MSSGERMLMTLMGASGGALLGVLLGAGASGFALAVIPPSAWEPLPGQGWLIMSVALGVLMGGVAGAIHIWQMSRRR